MVNSQISENYSICNAKEIVLHKHPPQESFRAPTLTKGQRVQQKLKDDLKRQMQEKSPTLNGDLFTKQISYFPTSQNCDKQMFLKKQQEDLQIQKQQQEQKQELLAKPSSMALIVPSQTVTETQENMQQKFLSNLDPQTLQIIEELNDVEIQEQLVDGLQGKTIQDLVNCYQQQRKTLIEYKIHKQADRGAQIIFHSLWNAGFMFVKKLYYCLRCLDYVTIRNEIKIYVAQSKKTKRTDLLMNLDLSECLKIMLSAFIGKSDIYLSNLKTNYSNSHEQTLNCLLDLSVLVHILSLVTSKDSKKFESIFNEIKQQEEDKQQQNEFMFKHFGGLQLLCQEQQTVIYQNDNQILNQQQQKIIIKNILQKIEAINSGFLQRTLQPSLSAFFHSTLKWKIYGQIDNDIFFQLYNIFDDDIYDSDTDRQYPQPVWCYYNQICLAQNQESVLPNKTQQSILPSQITSQPNVTQEFNFRQSPAISKSAMKKGLSRMRQKSLNQIQIFQQGFQYSKITSQRQKQKIPGGFQTNIESKFLDYQNQQKGNQIQNNDCQNYIQIQFRFVDINTKNGKIQQQQSVSESFDPQNIKKRKGVKRNRTNTPKGNQQQAQRKVAISLQFVIKNSELLQEQSQGSQAVSNSNIPVVNSKKKQSDYESILFPTQSYLQMQRRSNSSSKNSVDFVKKDGQYSCLVHDWLHNRNNKDAKNTQVSQIGKSQTLSQNYEAGNKLKSNSLVQSRQNLYTSNEVVLNNIQRNISTQRHNLEDKGLFSGKSRSKQLNIFQRNLSQNRSNIQANQLVLSLSQSQSQLPTKRSLPQINRNNNFNFKGPKLNQKQLIQNSQQPQKDNKKSSNQYHALNTKYKPSPLQQKHYQVFKTSKVPKAPGILKDTVFGTPDYQTIAKTFRQQMSQFKSNNKENVADGKNLDINGARRRLDAKFGFGPVNEAHIEREIGSIPISLILYNDPNTSE